jgi:hypothetical protein
LVGGRCVNAGVYSTEKTGPWGGEFSAGLEAWSRAISAAAEFPGNQLTNWGALERVETLPVGGVPEPFWGLVMT